MGLIAAVARGGGGEYRLVVVDRTIVQDQGSWRIDYRLRYEGRDDIPVTPSDIVAKVEGWVSNSRVPAHANPRWSSVVVSSSSGLSSTCEVIAAADEEQQCRERLIVRVWRTGDEPPADQPKSDQNKSGTRSATFDRDASTGLILVPGDTLRVRLRLEHQHFLYGDYDPLLARRAVELRLGSSVLRDTLPMQREQYFAQAKYTWPAAPDDRRDNRYFMSAPDSLHIEGHIPGNTSYRFNDRPVRYATRMRLRFWYLIAPGTEDECRARIMQYKESPTAARGLPDGTHTICLKAVGRWTQAEHVFRTESEATLLALEFQVCGAAEIGELWVDDVSLEPIASTADGP
jgi:hypothetical protein